jgi:hypothetical protein
MGTFFLSVDGTSGSFGAVTNAVNLGGVTVGTNGTITIILDPVNIAECVGRIYGSGSTFILIDDAFSVVGGNDDGPTEAESFLLVFTPLSVADGDDIDVNNDEVIDPARQITVVDGFAFTVNNGLQAAYAPVIYDAFLQGGGSAALPDAASRCPGNPTPLSVLPWSYGALPGSPDNTNGPFATPTNRAGYLLTPAAPNSACP